MNFKILAIRLATGDKPVKAFVDLELDNGFILRDFRVIHHNNGKAHIACPQVIFKGPEGLKSKTLITIPLDKKWEIESAILQEYRRVKRSNKDGQGNKTRLS